MTSPRSLAQRALPLLVLVGSLLVAAVLVARNPHHSDAAPNGARETRDMSTDTSGSRYHSGLTR